jgi:hypothetical protein
VPDPEIVPLNTAYGIATRDERDALALASLFNSRWISALAALRADPARGGFRRFNARVIRELPVPPADSITWNGLIECGRRRTSADDLIVAAFELDQTDCRALARVASSPHPV